MQSSPMNEVSEIQLISRANSKRFTKTDYFFGGIGFLLFCILCQKGPVIYADSIGYINNATIRSPLYPIILNIYSKCFGTNHYQWLVYGQILAGFFASIFTVMKFKNLCTYFFPFPKILFYLIILILLFPYYGPLNYGNNILSEAACYPLFLMVFSLLMEGLHTKNTRQMMIAIILSGLLVLTRGQFLFLYPAIAIILGYLLIYERKSFKIAILIFCFMVTVIGCNLFERTYQYIYHGQFKQVPFTGMQLINAPLYLAKESDVNLFKSETEQTLFTDIWNSMEQKKINFNSLKEDSYFHMMTYTHFYYSYNKICWDSLCPLLGKYKLSSPYQIDPFLTKMALTLIFNNLEGFFILYIMNIVFNLGGIYFLLLLTAAMICATYSFVKTRHPLSLAFLLVTLLNAGNYLLIALVEPVLRRYTTYTDGLQISILLIIIMASFHATLISKKEDKFLQNL